MRLFVTGGAGYVGSVTCETLVERGHEVTVFDDLSTGHRAAVPRGCRLVVGDLRDAAALRTALTGDFDAVLHFAARSLVPESMRDPVGYYDHNVGGAVALVQAMQAAGVRRLVFSSTAAVYGEPDTVPIPETHALVPTHAYGGSKRCIEMLLEDAMRAGAVEAIFLRYFNAAGASSRLGEWHDPETHLIPNLLNGALRGDAEVRIFGQDYPTPDGTCVRDYVHVVDLAEAHARALEALEGGVRGAINLGTGRGTSVREVLEAVRAVTGQPVPAKVEGRRPGDPPQLVADVQRAARDLGWTARYGDIEAIVASAWDWRQRHPQGYGSGGAGEPGDGADPRD